MIVMRMLKKFLPASKFPHSSHFSDSRNSHSHLHFRQAALQVVPPLLPPVRFLHVLLARVPLLRSLVIPSLLLPARFICPRLVFGLVRRPQYCSSPLCTGCCLATCTLSGPLHRLRWLAGYTSLMAPADYERFCQAPGVNFFIFSTKSRFQE